MPTHPLRFVHRGAVVTLADVAPDRTLLQVLREDLTACGTKEGCGEGDCGACTVVVGEPAPDGQSLHLKAINSCIRLAHSIDGMALWTVQDLATPDGSLHPVQQALVDCHASQCGFCTPGFVMSLFALYQAHPGGVDREEAQEALSGNLCRCTGYRPIVDAAQAMHRYRRVDLPEQHTLGLLATIKPASGASDYLQPERLADLLRLRAAHPQAQLVAGCTDVGLWVTKAHRALPQVLDVSRVAELRRIERYPHHLAIGAAVSLSDAFDALSAERPSLRPFLARFAGRPVRNAGTLGGNVANGSPIGDSMPLLLALGAHVVLMSARGHRDLPLADFYTGYRKNILAADEVLAWIKVPHPIPGSLLGAYKVSKRFEDDISAVCLAIEITLHDGVVERVAIGAGGVAATPVRAPRTEAALLGRALDEAAISAAQAVLCEEFEPLSDMRASAAYRRTVLGNLLRRFWLEQQGAAVINLQDAAWESAA